MLKCTRIHCLFYCGFGPPVLKNTWVASAGGAAKPGLSLVEPAPCSSDIPRRFPPNTTKCYLCFSVSPSLACVSPLRGLHTSVHAHACTRERTTVRVCAHACSSQWPIGSIVNCVLGLLDTACSPRPHSSAIPSSINPDWGDYHLIVSRF